MARGTLDGRRPRNPTRIETSETCAKRAAAFNDDAPPHSTEACSAHCSKMEPTTTTATITTTKSAT
jgi:hypothetical protein